MDGADQTEGQALFQQATQSHQPDVLVKRQFEQRNQNQKSKLANEFVASAGREGVSQLAATPDGQHALAVVYDHAGSDGRGLMRQVYEEQGNTAVDYSRKENGEGSAKKSPLGAKPINQDYLSEAQSSPESLSSDHRELVQQYASVIKKSVVKNENRVKENGVGNTIYTDIVNTLHSLAGSPMRVNESGQYRSSIQKPTTEKEQFNQLRQTGVVVELLMNEPEAQAIVKKEFGEAWDKVADWGAQEWTPFIAEATVVVGTTLIGKKSINAFKISDDTSQISNNIHNNNGIDGKVDAGHTSRSDIEGSNQTKSTVSGGRPADEPESARSSEGASSSPVDDPNSDSTMRSGTDAPNKESLIKELVIDSNTKFPLSEVNARKMLDEYVPEGFTPKTVAGPGGQGADLVLEGPNGQIFRIENKSTQSFRGFDGEISHAAQNQATGNLVFVQAPEGTDAVKWMARFWGNRVKAGMLDTSIPANAAKLDIYKNTDIVIYDPKGNLLLSRQPIFNPPK
ncbi:MAG: hypothetical protein ABW160_21660 [Candidatus Thiodiazotropha sp. 4PDIV1]